MFKLCKWGVAYLCAVEARGSDEFVRPQGILAPQLNNHPIVLQLQPEFRVERAVQRGHARRKIRFREKPVVDGAAVEWCVEGGGDGVRDAQPMVGRVWPKLDLEELMS